MDELEPQIKDYVAKAGLPLADKSVIAAKEDVVAALKTVYDPEIMIDVYNLGLIYGIDIAPNGNVKIDMTVTAPTCPVADMLIMQSAEAVAQTKGVGEVEVKLVWEPVWDISKLSEEAKATMEMVL